MEKASAAEVLYLCTAGLAWPSTRHTDLAKIEHALCLGIEDAEAGNGVFIH